MTVVIMPQARCCGSDEGVVIENRMELCIICHDCVASQDCPGTATFVSAVESCVGHAKPSKRDDTQPFAEHYD